MILVLFPADLQLHFHGSNMNRLQEWVPARVLPAEYGGTGEKMTTDELIEFLADLTAKAAAHCEETED